MNEATKWLGVGIGSLTFSVLVLTGLWWYLPSGSFSFENVPAEKLSEEQKSEVLKSFTEATQSAESNTDIPTVTPEPERVNVLKQFQSAETHAAPRPDSPVAPSVDESARDIERAHALSNFQ